MKMRMKTRSAGTNAAKMAQMGKERDDPRGLMNQPRRSAAVGVNPSGTYSF